MIRHRLGNARQIYYESGPTAIGCWHVTNISNGDTIDMSTAFSKLYFAQLMTGDGVSNLVVSIGTTASGVGVSPHARLVASPTILNNAAYLLAMGTAVS